jgi:hypothetical protein
MEGERANELASLAPYYARVRARQGNRMVEGVIKTFPSPLTEEVSADEADRIASIIEHSRATYCHPRQVVIDAIAERWERAGLSLEEQLPATAPDTPPDGARQRPRRSGRTAPALGARQRATPRWELLEDKDEGESPQ